MHGLSDRRQWIIFIIFWVIYLFHVGPIPGVNENRYIDLTMSIVDKGQLDIDQYHYNTVDKAYYDGHYYSGAAPGPSILAIPLYIIFETVQKFYPLSVFSQYDTGVYIRSEMGGTPAPDAFVATYPFSDFVLLHIGFTWIICSGLAALTVVLLYHILGWFDVKDPYRYFVLVIYAFGTITFFYATRLFAHVPSTFFIFLSFVILHGIYHGRLTNRWGVVAGISLGLGATMEYTVAPMVATIGIAGLFTLKRYKMVPFLVGSLAPVILLSIYHWICFGHPLTTPYDFPMSPDDPGRFRIMGANFHGFWIPGLDAIWGLSFSTYRGIFTYSPALIPAMYILFKRLGNHADSHRYDWIIISAGFFLQFLFNSAMIDFWSGGYVFGPRYLMPIIPFLMIPLGLAFQEVPYRLMIVLGGLSLLINWAGVQYIVSQSAFGSIAVFILSGPTTQLYQFLDTYFKTYGQWDIAISPSGGFLLLGVALTLFWKYSWGRHA